MCSAIAEDFLPHGSSSEFLVLAVYCSIIADLSHSCLHVDSSFLKKYTQYLLLTFGPGITGRSTTVALGNHVSGTLERS